MCMFGLPVHVDWFCIILRSKHLEFIKPLVFIAASAIQTNYCHLSSLTFGVIMTKYKKDRMAKPQKSITTKVTAWENRHMKWWQKQQFIKFIRGVFKIQTVMVSVVSGLSNVWVLQDLSWINLDYHRYSSRQVATMGMILQLLSNQSIFWWLSWFWTKARRLINAALKLWWIWWSTILQTNTVGSKKVRRQRTNPYHDYYLCEID